MRRSILLIDRGCWSRSSKIFISFGIVAMFQYELPRYLPTADELPCSDDTPVDNELQELIPSLLKSILQILWAERMDWFFGIDMAIYYHPEQPPFAKRTVGNRA